MPIYEFMPMMRQIGIMFMVKIRLSQTGTKNRKTYRFIAIEEGKRRDGSALEILGYYNPLVRPPQLVVKRDRIDHWLSVGAQMSPTAKKLLKAT